MGEIGPEAALSQFVPRAVENPGAQGVDPPDAGEIEDDVMLPRLGGDLAGQRLHHLGVLGGPVPGQPGRHLVARALDFHLRLLSQDALRHCHPSGIDSAW
jgi:hypothetical protein